MIKEKNATLIFAVNGLCQTEQKRSQEATLGEHKGGSIMVSKPTSFRLTEETKKQLAYISEQDKRSMAAEIEYLIEERYKELADAK